MCLTHLNWEPIGFTDLGTEEGDLDGLLHGNDTENKGDKGVATHVMNFFFKGVFANFEYPCAYSLTKGVEAPQLNTLFCQGMSLLHCHGFEVLLICCDMTSANRKFMKRNASTDDAVGIGYNFFSHRPMFMISDHPHLVKKLPNNLISSSFKNHSNLLKQNGSYILWQHIEAV